MTETAAPTRNTPADITVRVREDGETTTSTCTTVADAINTIAIYTDRHFAHVTVYVAVTSNYPCGGDLYAVDLLRHLFEFATIRLTD